jgi:hypothetical protein
VLVALDTGQIEVARPRLRVHAEALSDWRARHSRRRSPNGEVPPREFSV